MIDWLFDLVESGAIAAPLFGLALGSALAVSPVAMPMIPAVIATVSPGTLDPRGERVRTPIIRAFPAILAFTAGMNGMLGMVGTVFISVAAFLIRASVILHLLAAAIMGVIGLRLVFKRTSLCKRAQAIPLGIQEAFAFGVLFAFGGCPSCGPVALAVGSVASAVAGPGIGAVTILGFVVGHAIVLTAVAVVAGRALPSGTARVPWGRLDVTTGALFLAAALYLMYRVASGQVITKLPGDPGGPLAFASMLMRGV